MLRHMVVFTLNGSAALKNDVLSGWLLRLELVSDPDKLV